VKIPVPPLEGKAKAAGAADKGPPPKPADEVKRKVDDKDTPKKDNKADNKDTPRKDNKADNNDTSTKDNKAGNKSE
jgi:hypothetical protein